MIRFEQINTQSPYLDFMESLMKESFPVDEYRELSQLRDYMDNHPSFYPFIVFSDDKPVGLLNYWKFSNFAYGEHFAISSDMRNSGIGKEVFSFLLDSLDIPFVFEVESPDTDIAKRRINFYKRLGMILWDVDYIQPAYRKDSNPLPMKIMSSNGLSPQKDFEEVRSVLHREVYGLK